MTTYSVYDQRFKDQAAYEKKLGSEIDQVAEVVLQNFIEQSQAPAENVSMTSVDEAGFNYAKTSKTSINATKKVTVTFSLNQKVEVEFKVSHMGGKAVLIDADGRHSNVPVPSSMGDSAPASVAMNLWHQITTDLEQRLA
jgi:hypothetical protein